jgi:hypothetical protein
VRNNQIVIGIIILTIFCLVSSNLKAQARADNYEELNSAFLATGASYLGMELCGWVVQEGEYYPLEQLENLGKRFAEEYNLDWKEIELEKHNEDGFNSLHYRVRINEKEEIQFSAQSLFDQSDKGKELKESYLVITLASQEDLEQITVKANQLLSFLKSHKGNPKLTYSIHGVYPRFLTSKEKEDLLERFFLTLKGEAKDRAEEENYLSVTGYSPLIKEAITVGKDQVNVQIALTNYQSDGKTYLIIGCPLITIEY